MESKAMPAWANQEDVATGSAPVGEARSMGREEWNQRYAISEFLWTVDANRFLVAEAASLPPGRALDLATGEGRNAVWLAEQGWAVCAVDFAEVGLHKGRYLAARRGVAERVCFEAADLRCYRPEPGGFDLVTLSYLQIPQADLQPILVKAAQAVAPGGSFLLIAHDASNLTEGFGGPQDAAVLYTAEQVVAAVGHELFIEKAHTVERIVGPDDRPRLAIDCLVRGRRLS